MSTLLADARAVGHPTARTGGIGRHVTSLLRGLVERDVPVVALYGADAERAALAGAIPDLTLRRWSPAAVRDHALPGTWYLATQLMLHPVSLDPIPWAVSACRLPVAALMYDVIPYRHPDVYLVDQAPRLQSVLRRSLAATVDLMLANSAFVADTAAAELDYPIERIAVIGAAPDPMFTPLPPGERPRCDPQLTPGTGTYVMAVTGGLVRKNTPTLLRAWGVLDPAVRRGRKLVIVGGHSAEVRRAWDQVAGDAGIADEVIIAGRVSDDDLVALLRGAELAIVPATEEGFGLPVVEAAATGCPVICSDTSSFPEVLDEPLGRFDPFDHRAVADVLRRALTDAETRGAIAAAGARSLARWTWPRVADDLVAAISAATPRIRGAARPSPWRIAVPAADRSGRLIDLVSDGADGADVVDGVEASGVPFPPGAIERYGKPWRYDAIAMPPPGPTELARFRRLAEHGHVYLLIDLARTDDTAPDTAPDPMVLDAAASVIVGPADGSEQARAAAEHLADLLRSRTASPVLTLPGPVSLSALVDHVLAVDPTEAGR